MPMTSGPADFPTTRWTLVAAAGDPDRPDCSRALESLCEAYWYPLYVYARRSGDSAEEAQDHTQEFFTRFLEHNYFDRTDRDRGRFRSFLLSSCKYYRRDQADRARAQKRGSGVPLIPRDNPLSQNLQMGTGSRTNRFRDFAGAEGPL